MKDKKSITLPDGLQNFLNKSGCKPKIIWVDQGSRFYNSLLKSQLHDSDTEMYLIQQRKRCYCIKIYQDFEAQDLQVYKPLIKKQVH